MQDIEEIRASLGRYQFFGECVVQGLAWKDFGTTLCLTIEYAWHTDGTLRLDHEDRLFVRLCFRWVQEFGLHNHLRPQLLEEPSVLDWSFAEVSLLTVDDDERARQHAGLPIRMHHAMVRREGNIWMDIVFGELEMSEVSTLSDN